MSRYVTLPMAVVFSLLFLAPADLQADPIELVLVLDSSGSLGQSGWSNIEGFYADLFNSSPTLQLNGGVSVGVVQFASGAWVRWHLAPLGDETTLDALVHTIQDMDFTRGATHTRTAVQTAMDELEEHGSPGARRIIHLVTDGNPYPASEQNPSPLAAELDARDIEVNIMGIGDSWTPNLVSSLVDDVDTDILDFGSAAMEQRYDDIFSSAVPEPSTMSILAVAVVAVVVRRRRTYPKRCR